MSRFLDKMNLTGSIFQFINGVILLSTFAGSRLVYGFYQVNNIHIIADFLLAAYTLSLQSYTFYQTLYSIRDQFPQWLLLTYAIGNVILCTLNVLWFQKMIAALQKRMVKGPEANGNGKAVNGHAANGKKKD